MVFILSKRDDVLDANIGLDSWLRLAAPLMLSPPGGKSFPIDSCVCPVCEATSGMLSARLFGAAPTEDGAAEPLAVANLLSKEGA